MEAIIKLVRQIIFLLIMFTFLELLLPLGQIKNFTRTVIGLLILLAILTPLVELFGANWNMEVFLPEEKGAFAVSGSSIMATAKAEAAKGLETQIKALLNLNGEKVDRVKVELGENKIDRVVLVLKKPLAEDEKKRFCDLLNAFFGVLEKVEFQVGEVGP